MISEEFKPPRERFSRFFSWFRRELFGYNRWWWSRRQLEFHNNEVVRQRNMLEHDLKLAMLNGWWCANHPLSAHIQVSRSLFHSTPPVTEGYTTKILPDGTIQPL